MKTAILFAGQGSQAAGMGRDFYEKYECFRSAFDCLSVEEKKIAWEGPNERLSETVYTQPVMLAYGLGVYNVLVENGMDFEYGAGLSLGEYTALAAAGVWSAKEAVELVRYRAQAMQKAAYGVNPSMYAVLGMSSVDVAKCCVAASADGGVAEITNLNCPGQIVISGDKETVEAAVNALLEMGARRCLPLDVSGPFHTSYMLSAGTELKNKFESLEFGKPRFKILYNCIGRERNEEEDIQNLLIRQVSTGVLMEDIIRNIIATGVEQIIEVGPGKTLAGFVKKIDSGISCISINCVTDIEKVI